MHRELLINGFFIGGPCDGSIGKELIRNPFNGSSVGTVAEGGWLELRTCIDSAQSAFESWKHSDILTRQALLSRISKTIQERREELAGLLVDEIGKPIALALGEVDRTAITFELAARELDRWSPETVSIDLDPRGQNFTACVQREPFGIVFAIIPYNWPLNLAAHKIAPALATGSTVVLKPSPQAPLSTLTLARLIHECGCPPGVLNAWNGPTPLVQKGLDDTRIKTISFTGSDAVGRTIRQRYWDRNVILECGGDAYAIVCADSDLEEVANQIAVGAFSYAGQICISVQHVLVEESVADRFQELLVRASEETKTGDPSDPHTVCGPIISSEAVDRAMGLVDEALAGGAKLLCGNERLGTLMTPTLVSNLPNDCQLAKVEAFSPILTMRSFGSFQDAIATVNRSRYGIHTGVFTDDQIKIQAAIRDLEVGGVVINAIPTMRFDNLPYGGTKDSGVGKEGVRYAMEAFTTPKSVLIRKRG